MRDNFLNITHAMDYITEYHFVLPLLSKLNRAHRDVEFSKSLVMQHEYNSCKSLASQMDILRLLDLDKYKYLLTWLLVSNLDKMFDIDVVDMLEELAHRNGYKTIVGVAEYLKRPYPNIRLTINTLYSIDNFLGGDVIEAIVNAFKHSKSYVNIDVAINGVIVTNDVSESDTGGTGQGLGLHNINLNIVDNVATVTMGVETSITLSMEKVLEIAKAADFTFVKGSSINVTKDPLRSYLTGEAPSVTFRNKAVYNEVCVHLLGIFTEAKKLEGRLIISNSEWHDGVDVSMDFKYWQGIEYKDGKWSKFK